MKTRPVIRYLLIAAGTISVALGLLGAFIPVLPTTPFLLLASYCYVRSSPRLYHWLIHHRIFGAYIYNYLTHRAIRRSTKIGTLVFLWATLIISFLAVPHPHIRIFLVLVGVCVTIHISRLRTMADEDFQVPPQLSDMEEQNQ